MKHCIACGRELPERSLFVLDGAPASAQDIPDAEEVKMDRGVTLKLCQCEHCGLVQFDCIPVSYYRDVIRAGGFSTTMTELRRRQYRHLIEAYHLEGKKFIEVGCGRGEFLQVLREFPVEVYGMEHRQALVDIAVEQGLTVWKEFPETSGQVFGCGKVQGPFDVFLSFNFLEHQPEPEVMLKAICRNLAEDGMGLVTVPSLEYILEQGSYYELIRDHIAYYSFGTLRRLLERCGFEVLEEEMVNRDTIAMIVRKRRGADTAEDTAQQADRAAEGTAQQADRADAARQTDRAAADVPISVAPILEGCRQVNRDVQELLARLDADGKRLAIWGASHQGFTLAATTGLGGQAAYIIDSAPFKQGRFAPASHLPIVHPDHFLEEPVDAILIVAPGYTEEIAGVIRQRFGGQVEILTLRTNRIEKLRGAS